MRVGDALHHWRRSQGFGGRGTTGRRGARVLWLKLGPIPIPVPNPGQLHWHDLHHVALGCDSTLAGEAEVSAFELRTRPRNKLVWWLCVGSVCVGLLVAPRSVLRGWRHARGCRNLYSDSMPYAEVLDWSCEALRAWMQAPAEPRRPESDALREG